MTLRLIAERSLSRPSNYAAHLDGELIAMSDQPLVDAARELLKRGYDPATLLTMRHAGSNHDSFSALPIGEWAKWTYVEGSRRALYRDRWSPRPDGLAPIRRTDENRGSST